MFREDIKTGVSIAVTMAFEGRKGHGGGECTKRVLDREHLKRFGNSAVQRTLDVQEHRTHYCESYNCPGYAYKASDRSHPAEICNDRPVDPSFAVLRKRSQGTIDS